MKLFTKEIDRMLFNQYPKGADLEDQVVVAKIFNPYGRGTWYLINSDPQDPDYLWVIADFYETEVGSASRSELESIRIKIGGMQLGLERDLSFSPKKASEVLSGLLQGKHFKRGGKMAKGGNVGLKSDITLNGVEYVEIPYEKAKEMFETGEIEIMMIDSDESIQSVEYLDDLNDDGMIVARLEDLKKSDQKLAKGGRITADNIESIAGKYMQIYSPGDQEPSIYYITSVKKSDPKFSRKSVTIQTDGGRFIIPESEIVNLDSKGVSYKEAGMKEPMMLYLMKDSYAVGGKITIRNKRYLDVVKKTINGTPYRFTLQYHPTFKNYFIQIDSDLGSSNEYSQTLAMLPPESTEIIESMVSQLSHYLKHGEPGK